MRLVERAAHVAIVFTGSSLSVSFPLDTTIVGFLADAHTLGVWRSRGLRFFLPVMRGSRLTHRLLSMTALPFMGSYSGSVGSVVILSICHKASAPTALTWIWSCRLIMRRGERLRKRCLRLIKCLPANRTLGLPGERCLVQR